VLHQNSVLGCFTSLAMTTCLVRFLKMAKLQLMPYGLWGF